MKSYSEIPFLSQKKGCKAGPSVFKI